MSDLANIWVELSPAVLGILGTIAGAFVGGLISRRTNSSLSVYERRIAAYSEYMDAFALISEADRKNKLRFYAAHNKALLVSPDPLRAEFKNVFTIVVKAMNTKHWKPAIDAVNALAVLLAEDVAVSRLSKRQKLKRYFSRRKQNHTNPPPFLPAGGGNSSEEAKPKG